MTDGMRIGEIRALLESMTVRLERLVIEAEYLGRALTALDVPAFKRRDWDHERRDWDHDRRDGIWRGG